MVEASENLSLERATGDYQTFTLEHGETKRITKYVVPIDGYESFTCGTAVGAVSGKMWERETFAVSFGEDNRNVNYYHTWEMAAGWGGYTPKRGEAPKPLIVEVTNYSLGPVTYRVYWNLQYLQPGDENTVWDGYSYIQRPY